MTTNPATRLHRRYRRLAPAVSIALVTACASGGGPTPAPSSSANATSVTQAQSLPNVPPPSPGCPSEVKAQQDIHHPTLGTVRLFLLMDPSPGPHRDCVSAIASNGKALTPIQIDVAGNSLAFANPVTDATGNAFITYNPGRYDGILVLVPTADGFEDIGWDNNDTRYSGKRAYYYAKLNGPGPDGRYTITQFNNNCEPSCAGGSVTSQVLHWDGHDYVP